MFFLADAEAGGLLVLPVGLEHFGGDFVVVGVPASTDDFMGCGHFVVPGVALLWVEAGVVHYVQEEPDGVCAVFVVLAHSLGEVGVQGYVVVGVFRIVGIDFERGLSAPVSVASPQDFFGCCHAVCVLDAEFLGGEWLVPSGHYVGQKLGDGVAFGCFLPDEVGYVVVEDVEVGNGI